MRVRSTKSESMVCYWREVVSGTSSYFSSRPTVLFLIQIPTSIFKKEELSCRFSFTLSRTGTVFNQYSYLSELLQHRSVFHYPVHGFYEETLNGSFVGNWFTLSNFSYMLQSTASPQVDFSSNLSFRQAYPFIITINSYLPSLLVLDTTSTNNWKVNVDRTLPIRLVILKFVLHKQHCSEKKN